MGMSRTVKNILTLVICLVVLAGIGVGIYFAYKATEKPRDPDAVAIVVTYDANGGEIETETSSVYKDNNYGTLPVPTRTGYTFDGWYTALENGAKVESSTLVTATEDHTLYANWTINTYNVVLNENGGNDVEDLTYTVETTTLTLPTLTRDGYTFNGWFTAEVAGTKVESTDILSKLENQTYYAQWTANQFTVIFDSNKPASTTAEVVGTMENQTFTYDVLQNLTANTYSLEYYNFAGWSTTANGSVEFTDGQSVKNLAAEGSITLYAVWLADNERVITFEGNGVVVNPSSMIVTVGEAYGALPTLTRAGYTFDGWFTALENGTRVETTTTVPQGANHTLYAHWTINTYNVVLNENGGNNVEDLTYTVETTTLTLPTLTRDGYTFNGWFTAEVGGTKVEPTDILSKLGNQGYYAHWTVITYNVVLNENGGNDVEDLTYTVETTTLTLPTLTRDGYTFNGWFTAEASGTKVESTDILSKLENQTYYAQWTANQFTVIFDSNKPASTTAEVVGTMENQTFTYDVLQNLTANTYSLEYYNFAGWSTTANGSVEFTDGQSVKNLATEGSITLYAVWLADNERVITFEGNGVVVNPSTTIVTVGDAYGALPTLTRAGYTFDGWFTALENGTRVETTTTVPEGADHTLYAHWTINTYNVVLNENGGSDVEDLTYTVETTTLTLPTLTKANYVFTGWFTAEVGGTKVEATDILSKLENQEYYAQWTPEEYDVILDENGGDLINDITYTIESEDITLPTPTRDGYTFIGWFGVKVVSGTTYYVGMDFLTTNNNALAYTSLDEANLNDTNKVVAIDCDVFAVNIGSGTLIAKWEEIVVLPVTVEITFNANGGSVNPSTTTLTVGEAYGTLPTPTRAGYAFDGWYTAETNGDLIKSTTIVEDSENHTLYAHWIVNVGNEDLSLNLLQNTAGNTVATITDGTTYQIVDPETKSGYKVVFTTTTQSVSSIYNGGIVNLSDAIIDPDDETGTAVITGWAGQPTEISIPEYISVNGATYKVVGISEYAFNGCSTLTNITIANSVVNIGHHAFYNCENLTSARLGSGISSLSWALFYKCGKLENINIPSSVLIIEQAAFQDCTSLSNIKLPANIATIGLEAFRGCSKLNNVLLPDSLNTINAYAFYGCSSLTEIIIPENVQTLPNYVFSACALLNKVVLPTTLKTIGSDAFYMCYALSEIEIPNGVTSIGVGAFGHTSIKSITIPTGVTAIESHTFIDCAELKTISLPAGITIIGYQAFNGCSNLESITLLSGLITIDDYAFSGCANLKSVVIPEGVTTIGKGAFELCSNLESVDIPSTVVSFGSRAFQNCTSLTKITIRVKTPPSLEDLYTVPSGTTVYVPSGSVDAYKNAPGWSKCTIKSI